MKDICYYIGNDYCIKSTKLVSFTYDSFIESYNHLTNKIPMDDFTSSHIRKFIEEGYTDKRVEAAADINMTDQMLLFAYDGGFEHPLGLAVIFDHKFYGLGLSCGVRSESELYDMLVKCKPMMSEEIIRPSLFERIINKINKWIRCK